MEKARTSLSSSICVGWVRLLCQVAMKCSVLLGLSRSSFVIMVFSMYSDIFRVWFVECGNMISALKLLTRGTVRCKMITYRFFFEA